MNPSTSPLETRLWCEAEPLRLERDRAEIRLFAPSLRYVSPQASIGCAGYIHGGWEGALPLWPFERPEPEGLELLVPRGLEIRLCYSAAYPVVQPEIFPICPEPSLFERSQASWHVLPGGALCLLQSDGAWLPETSIVDLLLKAAGWNVEYALMQAGAIDEMTTCGIVNDPSRDRLLSIARELGRPGDG